MEVTAEQYDHIEELYLNCEVMDKDAFCADYKKHSDSGIIEELNDKVRSLRICLERTDKQIADLKEQRLEMVDFLIAQHHATGAEALRAQAIAMVGETTYLRRKLACRIAYDNTDYEMLEAVLNENIKK